MTHVADFYHYRTYLETIVTYGRDAASSHLTNALWYRDTGDMVFTTIHRLKRPVQTRGAARDATE